MRAEIREKGSRFLAIVGPIESPETARRRLAELASELPDATHHCWAWRVGAAFTERSADAGEPAGTAGVPILQVLRGAELSDVLAVVVRWFGGVKLGKGGLARAYAAAVREAVASLPVTLRIPRREIVVELPYERLGAVKRLIHPPEVELRQEVYGERVSFCLGVQMRHLGSLRAALADLGIGLNDEM